MMQNSQTKQRADLLNTLMSEMRREFNRSDYATGDQTHKRKRLDDNDTETQSTGYGGISPDDEDTGGDDNGGNDNGDGDNGYGYSNGHTDYGIGMPEAEEAEEVEEGNNKKKERTIPLIGYTRGMLETDAKEYRRFEQQYTDSINEVRERENRIQNEGVKPYRILAPEGNAGVMAEMVSEVDGERVYVCELCVEGRPYSSMDQESSDLGLESILDVF